MGCWGQGLHLGAPCAPPPPPRGMHMQQCLAVLISFNQLHPIYIGSLFKALPYFVSHNLWLIYNCNHLHLNLQVLGRGGSGAALLKWERDSAPCTLPQALSPPLRALHSTRTVRAPNVRNANRNERSRGRSLLHGHGAFSTSELGGWRLVAVCGWRQLAAGSWWSLGAALVPKTNWVLTDSSDQASAIAARDPGATGGGEVRRADRDDLSYTSLGQSSLSACRNRQRRACAPEVAALHWAHVSGVMGR